MRSDWQRLIEDIQAEVSMTAQMTGRTMLDARVMEAMRTVPRHLFVPPELDRMAYENAPLSIGYGQTISQPYIVALMTDMLDLDKADVVLEVGTGSGYQAAVLSCLARRVYSVEVVEPLATAAAGRLADLGYDNVEVSCSDGCNGWPEHAPYDAIMVTAAAGHLPEALVKQLKAGGRMAVPIGRPGYTQELALLTKYEGGEVQRQEVLPVVFVPLVGSEME